MFDSLLMMKLGQFAVVEVDESRTFEVCVQNSLSRKGQSRTFQRDKGDQSSLMK